MRESEYKSIKIFILQFGLPKNVSFYESNLISRRFFIELGQAQKIYIYIYNFYRSWIVACIEFENSRVSRTPVAKVLELLIFYAASLDANSFSFRDEQNVCSTR